jgi:hypothetical protein
MNSPTRTNDTPSSRYLLGASAVAMALSLTLAACDKKPDGASAKDGAAAETPPAAAETNKPKTTRKTADVKSAYAAELNNNATMTDPTAKKVAAFEARVGKPDTDTGRKKTWLTIDGSQCTKMELDTQDGSITEMTAASADCGL